jgi:uncharacterized membrane protein
LTSLGVLHAAIGRVAVAAAIVARVRYKEISPKTLTGKVYVITTVLTCLTGFGIFQHGGFGKPHALGIITLVALGAALLPGPEAPQLQVASGVLFLFFLIGAVLQVRRLRAHPAG